MSIAHSEEQDAVLDERDFDDRVEDVDDSDEFSDTDLLDADDFSDTLVYEANDGPVDDFIGDSSIVFDVEDVVAEFEAEGSAEGSTAYRLRKRLEAIAERKRRHQDLMDFGDYDLDF